MEIRQFRYFVKIADLGSFSKAATVLHIAQPALSQQMAQLEAELGQPLLVRGPSGVKLTDQGTVFYRHAQRLLQQLVDTRSAVAAAVDNPSGSVSVGLPQSTAAQYAMPLLHAMRSRYPAVEIEFFDEISGRLLAGLNSGRLDIGVFVNDEEASMVQAVPLMQETLFLLSRADMAPRRKTITLAQLARLPLAVPGQGQGVRPILEQALRAAGLPALNVAILANSMSIMKRAMADGLAHSVMPWAAVAGELGAGTLVATPITPALQRRVHVCTARDANLSLAGQAVLATLLDTTREQVRSGIWQGVSLL